MAKVTAENAEMFAAKGADHIYSTIVSKLRLLVGAKSVLVDPKQTCVHLIAQKGGTAFAGLHPRKNAVLVTIKLNEPLKSRRIRKTEKASANRYHLDVLVLSKEEVNDELLGWLQSAWQLCMEKAEAKATKSKA